MDFKIRVITGVWENSPRNANLPLESQVVIHPSESWGSIVIDYIQRAILNFDFGKASLSIHGKAISADTLLRNEFLPSHPGRWHAFVSMFDGIQTELMGDTHHFVLYIPDDNKHEIFHIYVRTY